MKHWNGNSIYKMKENPLNQQRVIKADLISGKYLETLSKDYIKNVSFVPFFGCFAQQNPLAYCAFNKLFLSFNFKNIIEIGTFDGGMSVMFSLFVHNSNAGARESEGDCDNNYQFKSGQFERVPKNFHTFDIKAHNPHAIDTIELLGGHFHKEDCFENEQKIADIIKEDGRTLLLCDGGDKKREINTFSKYLKNGDVIMGHDYFESQKELETYKDEWSHPQLCYEDIKDCFDKEGITSIHKSVFQPAYWLCGIKL